MKFRSLFFYFFLCLFCLAGYTQTHKIDGQYMTDWLILGPIAGIDLEEDYLAEVGGESEIMPKEGDTFKTKDQVTRTPLKTGGVLRCSERVSISCFTSGTRRVNLVTNPVISHERGKDRKKCLR